MVKHEEKYCPRCNTVFECKVGSILICQCTTVRLNEKERDYMREKFDDCLCASCMKEVRAEYHNNKLKSKIKRLLGTFERE
jgi:hypothetical protein